MQNYEATAEVVDGTLAMEGLAPTGACRPGKGPVNDPPQINANLCASFGRGTGGADGPYRRPTHIPRERCCWLAAAWATPRFSIAALKESKPGHLFAATSAPRTCTSGRRSKILRPDRLGGGHSAISAAAAGPQLRGEHRPGHRRLCQASWATWTPVGGPGGSIGLTG
jgi:hypothetical protein